MNLSVPRKPAQVVVIGGGPAGLMAAEVMATAAAAGQAVQVTVYDAMPSVGRKFLLAGKGGLNLTHSEALAPFIGRYGLASSVLEPMLAEFGAQQLREWVHSIGVSTFVGSSGRVFPTDMKAAPLLRAWIHRLRSLGVQFSMRHRWLGWSDDGSLRFATPHGETILHAGEFDAVVLALGGGSWARLGSDGAWCTLLADKGVGVAPLLPSNCGFDAVGGDASSGSHGSGWTPLFASKFAGSPFKSVALSFTDSKGNRFSRKGEFVATASGVEGSLIYAVSNLLRDEIIQNASATFLLDLLPDKTLDQVLAEVRHPRGSRSLSSHLKSRLGLVGIKAAILYEMLSKEAISEPTHLAAGIKALPIKLIAARPLDEAISSAGGVRFESVDGNLRVKAEAAFGCPLFCAGEMLDWEAPTGGYLLTACFASGRRAGRGVLHFLGWVPPP